MVLLSLLKFIVFYRYTWRTTMIDWYLWKGKCKVPCVSLSGKTLIVRPFSSPYVSRHFYFLLRKLCVSSFQFYSQIISSTTQINSTKGKRRDSASMIPDFLFYPNSPSWSCKQKLCTYFIRPSWTELKHENF